MALEMRPNGLLALALALSFFSAAAAAALAEGSIIDASNASRMNVYYDVSAKAFMDATPSVPDATLRVYSTAQADIDGKNATFAYHVGNLTIPVSMGSNSKYLQALSAPVWNGTHYYASVPASAYLNFLSSQAVYPALVFVAVSDDDNVSQDDSFAFVPAGNGWLPGSYSVSASYNQNTFQESVSVTGASVTTPAGGTVAVNFNDLPSPTPRNNLLVGVCTDSQGANCSGTARTLPNTANLLSAGITPSTILPQNRYIVVNGISSGICIGPDLTASGLSSNSSTPLDGDVISITLTVSNPGNANANYTNANGSFSPPFNFTVKLYDVYQSVPSLVFETSLRELNASASSSFSLDYNTSGRAGSHSFIAAVDAEGLIGECAEANNNRTMALSVSPVCTVQVLIDGNASVDFPNAARPYNLSFAITRSGNSAANETIRLTEKNGLNIALPIQAWNESGDLRGLASYSIAEFRTNGSGEVSIAVIPSGDRLFQINPGLEAYVGNYSFVADTCMNDARPIRLNFTVGPSINATRAVQIPNQPQVQTVADQVYATFASVRKWLTAAFP